jgi:4-hydroxy-tetrahydrodipicolinate reductase
MIRQKLGSEDIEITSIREGDAAGQHVIMLDSPNDTMMLVHDAKSRSGFAEGAVMAAEWLQGKKGFFEFKDALKK